MLKNEHKQMSYGNGKVVINIYYFYEKQVWANFLYRVFYIIINILAKIL